MAKVLLTTTSYQEIPGPHHNMLADAGLEIVKASGPLTEAQMLDLVGDFNAFLCGDDALTRQVLEKSLPRLKVISKYGIGIDKIDVAAATEFGIPLSNCPGVNHTTVAEHALALILAVVRNIVVEANYVAAGKWKRLTGHETRDKTIAMIGMGRIGQATAERAKAFGMKLIGFGNHWPEEFANKIGVQRVTVEEAFERADIISLHCNLNDKTRNLVDANALNMMKDGVVIVNTARGGVINTADMVAALKSGKVAGYATDVLDEEPPPENHPLIGAPNCIITPHVGSRTYESVERQAVMATQNLLNMLQGEKPLAQDNNVPIPKP